MGTTERVAKFIVDFEYSKVPAKGIENIKTLLLDALGNSLVGATESTGSIITDFVKEMGGSPQARVIRSGFKTSILDAALANGTLAHALDFDDSSGFGHTGPVLVPPILALGEHLKLSGKKAIEAYTVGFEVGTKMRALGSVELEAGFHGTCLMGTIGATAEASKLLDLNLEQTRAAIGISASLASGIMQNFGTDGKALHAGHAARNGILAASLAKRGFTGDPDVLEGPKGFFYVYGQENGDIKRVTENLGRLLNIAEGHVLIKAWPCGHGNHPAITGIFNMIAKYDLKPEQIQVIEVKKGGAREGGGLIRHNPKHGYEGKFSTEYNVATALVDRKIDIYSYTDEKLTRPMIQELIKKVNVFQDPAIAALPPRCQDTRTTSVTVWLKDGRVLVESNVQERELHGEEITNKFRDNARIAGMPDSKIAKAISLVKSFENLADITELMDNVVV